LLEGNRLRVPSSEMRIASRQGSSLQGDKAQDGLTRRGCDGAFSCRDTRLRSSREAAEWYTKIGTLAAMLEDQHKQRMRDASPPPAIQFDLPASSKTKNSEIYCKPTACKLLSRFRNEKVRRVVNLLKDVDTRQNAAASFYCSMYVQHDRKSSNS